MYVGVIHGATAYEAQIGRLWFSWPRWSYLRAGVRPFIRLAPEGD